MTFFSLGVYMFSRFYNKIYIFSREKKWQDRSNNEAINEKRAKRGLFDQIYIYYIIQSFRASIGISLNFLDILQEIARIACARAYCISEFARFANRDQDVTDNTHEELRYSCFLKEK
ncbi:hypothetical protein ACJX0J_014351, partial [Zea mays]